GIFEPQEHITVGPDTLRAMDRYKVRTAIIGASGLNAEGVSEALLRAGEVYAAMVEKSGLCRKPHGNIDWGMRALPFQGVRRCSVADISISDPAVRALVSGLQSQPARCGRDAGRAR